MLHVGNDEIVEHSCLIGQAEDGQALQNPGEPEPVVIRCLEDPGVGVAHDLPVDAACRHPRRERLRGARPHKRPQVG